MSKTLSLGTIGMYAGACLKEVQTDLRGRGFVTLAPIRGIPEGGKARAYLGTQGQLTGAIPRRKTTPLNGAFLALSWVPPPAVWLRFPEGYAPVNQANRPFWYIRAPSAKISPP